MKLGYLYALVQHAGLFILLSISFTAKSEELCVSFEGNHQVAGVLELPVQATDTVALILPGTHTSDRNGPAESFVEGEGVYTGLARLLRAQGLAVARIDMPTTSPVGADAGCGAARSPDRSVNTQRAAYRAVAEYLRKQKQGRHFRHLLFVGHSQGGLVAAQILARWPRLADGFYMVSMTLGPVIDMARYQQRNIPMQAIRSIMDNGPDSCISNDQIMTAHTVLEEAVRPIERWLAPSGHWCKNSLDQLEARFAALAERGAQLAHDCDPASQEDHVGEFGNTCQELQLFYSQDSVAQLLRGYHGKVGIAYGKRDALVTLGTEGNAFRSFAAKAPTKRQVLLLDMGHNFGVHPYHGPAQESAMDAFARFVAGAMSSDLSRSNAASLF